MVGIRNMNEAEYRAFVREEIVGYAETALSESQKEFDGMLPDGIATANQFVSFIEDAEAGKPVGEIWYGYEAEDGVRQVFLAEFLIYAPE